MSLKAIREVGNVVRMVMPDGSVNAIGHVIALSESPSFLVEKSDGQRIVWPTTGCCPADLIEEVKYWKDRALRAEKQPVDPSA